MKPVRNSKNNKDLSKNFNLLKNQLKISNRVEKVIYAMSGGVDSSVAAALLKRDGFNVIGVFMKLWPEKYFSLAAQRTVKNVCSQLGIPFLVFNLTKEFKKKVIDYFLREYQRGRTPNPCVECNREIKFGLFFKRAINSGADFVATGHYARLRREIRNSKFEIRKLLIAKDKEKDQSYFLYNLTQKHLKKVLFPIGNYTKPQIRDLAKEFGIYHLVRPESRDICFIKGRHQDFLKKYLKLKPGPIFDTSGKKIGQHQGLPLYTIGQRKEIKVPGAFPYYVLKLDFKNNALIVTNNERDLYKKELVAEKVNWVSGKEPKLPLKIKAKIRYLHPDRTAKIVSKVGKRSYLIEFSRVQRAITPGQSVVFYSPAQISKKFVAGKGEELLGGGIICEKI